MSLSSHLQRIQVLSGASVDRNFGLGWTAVEQQLTLLENELVDQERVGRTISKSKRWLTELKTMASPHTLPSDYLQFLEDCGGLAINSEVENIALAIFGIGPAADIWYSPVVEVNTDIRHATGMLLIASWHWRAPQEGALDALPEVAAQDGHVLTLFDEDYPMPSRERLERFWLNVSNALSHGSIHLEQMSSSAISKGRFLQVAASFTAWLDIIASTEGRLTQLIPRPM